MNRCVVFCLIVINPCLSKKQLNQRGAFLNSFLLTLKYPLTPCSVTAIKLIISLGILIMRTRLEIGDELLFVAGLTKKKANVLSKLRIKIMKMVINLRLLIIFSHL